MASDKMDFGTALKQIGWNSVAPVADQDGGVLPGTLMKSGQEVVYSKILRKMVGYDRKSWMELVMFSLVTAGTDEGMGAWFGEHKRYADMGFTDVLYEAVRPIVSVLFINWVFNVSYVGFHNPMRSFDLKHILIALAAKDLSVGGNVLLSTKTGETIKGKLDTYEQMIERMQRASRFQTSGDD